MKAKQNVTNHDARIKDLLAKELPPITDEERKELAWKNILDSVPGAPKFGLFTMIDAYENEGREKLKELSNNRPKKDHQIRDIRSMLTYFREVRIYIEMNDTEGAALSMALAVQSAMKARIRPVEPLIEKGKQFTDKKDEEFKKKVKAPKEIREALAKILIEKYPNFTGSKLATKITSKGMPFKHKGVDYYVYQITKKARSGARGIYIRFESMEARFDYEMDTFLRTLRKSQ